MLFSLLAVCAPVGALRLRYRPGEAPLKPVQTAPSDANRTFGVFDASQSGPLVSLTYRSTLR